MLTTSGGGRSSEVEIRNQLKFIRFIILTTKSRREGNRWDRSRRGEDLTVRLRRDSVKWW